ncbi:MAG: hypothetical protein IT444_05480 [Phycisphaeraceae bacterium]|nr:hypothetical protein [Phycisphaeraceae bacterium]
MSTSSILVLAERSDRWFNSPQALAELLHLEGINDLQTAWLDELTPAMLADRSLILLGPADPEPTRAAMLLEFVAGGGGLVAVMPGEALAAQMGIPMRFEGRLHARVGAQGAAFPDSGLPTRGWSAFYSPAPETEVTHRTPLLEADGKPADASAILTLRRGKGCIVALAYDLLTTVYTLRQGDPMLAGVRNTGIARMRPADLFAGIWNPQDAAFPGADLHCRLLRELVHRAWPGDTVLPWLWYYPNNVPTMVVFTSDDDYSTREQFEALISAVDEHNAGITFYLVRDAGKSDSAMDPKWFEELASRGYDFSIHPDLPPPTGSTWDAKLGSHVEQFRRRYGRAPSGSIRNHCIAWTSYLEGPRIEARHGFTWDCNYYSLPPRASRYMTASGLPLPFASPQGEVLPVTQLASQFSDETTLNAGFSAKFSLNLTVDAGIKLVTETLAENIHRYHSMLCFNSHPVSFATYSSPMWVPVLRYAREHGVPVWNVARFRKFWEKRRATVLRPVKRGAREVRTDAELGVRWPE